MKREIKFRGKRIDNGEWIIGDLVEEAGNNETYIVNASMIIWNKEEVDPSTVGQLTGLKDKNGKEIYEGDRLKCIGNTVHSGKPYNLGGHSVGNFDIATMENFPGTWLEKESFGWEGEDLEAPTDWEITGNIHDK